MDQNNYQRIKQAREARGSIRAAIQKLDSVSLPYGIGDKTQLTVDASAAKLCSAIDDINRWLIENFSEEELEAA